MTDKNDDMVGTLFHDIAHQIRHRFEVELRPFELTRAGWLAIGIVEANDRLSQSELADYLELGAAATGKTVDRLEERGLLERHADPEDRRTKRLSATPQARKLIKTLRPIATRIRNDVLQDLAEKDRNKLKSYLVTIKARLSRLNNAEPTQDV